MSITSLALQASLSRRVKKTGSGGRRCLVPSPFPQYANLRVPAPSSAVDVMTPNRRKIHLGVSIFLLAVTGCGPTKPPNVGLEEVARSLDAARDAGAPTYAPMELRNAEDHLSQARARFAKRDYDEAVSLAQEAQVDSELAA